jgi:hypothetical protein
MAMNVEAEIRDLKRRVGELEGSFGFPTQQIKSVHKDLIAFQGKTEQDLAEIRGDVREIRGTLKKMDGRFDQLEGSVRTLREDLPGIVGDAVRPLLRSPNGNRRKKND